MKCHVFLWFSVYINAIGSNEHTQNQKLAHFSKDEVGSDYCQSLPLLQVFSTKTTGNYSNIVTHYRPNYTGSLSWKSKNTR